MNQKLVAIFLGAVVVVAALITVYRYLAWDSQSPELVLLEVDGEVRLTNPMEEVQASAGRTLLPEDRLATGSEARAVLGLGSDTRIRLGSSSTVQVRSVDEEGVRLELENGALHAIVRSESGAVRVGNRNREVLSTNGEFEFGARDGMIAINAIAGELMMAGVDGVRMEAGSRATISDGHAEIGPIPDELLLEVAWPESLKKVRDDSYTVEGKTAPGARVTISGEFGSNDVLADKEGVFRAVVPLNEGGNTVAIRAVDLLGNLVDVTGFLPTRDTRGPQTYKIGVEYER